MALPMHRRIPHPRAMSTFPNAETEDTLDPKTPEGWASLRELGQGMVTEALRYLQTIRDRPAWQPLPDAVRKRLTSPLPTEGEGLEGTWREFTGDVRRTGLFGLPRMTLYASRETHACVRRGVEVLGLGSESLRSLPVNQDFRVDVRALRAAIARDRAEGLRPFCVVGNAGTVNTG